MATLCIRVVGPSIFLTSMTAEAARVDSCHTGAIVMVGLDFESGAPERGFGTPRATFGRSQLRRKFGQSRAEGIRISVHREARRPYGAAPTGAGKGGRMGSKISRTTIALVAFLAALCLAPRAQAASPPEIETSVRATLEDFFREVWSGRELANKAVAILVFPTIVKAGFGIGGEYGEGALHIRGRTAGYYNIISASIGFQFGAQARSAIIMFMTEAALADFQRTDGWKVGVDGSIAIITVGAGGQIDTNSISSPVIGFIFDQKGLMYNLTLEGSKISRIQR
jgi:lipid-binding SYLF domain-containing protein